MTCSDEIRECILNTRIDVPSSATATNELTQSIANIVVWAVAGAIPDAMDKKFLAAFGNSLLGVVAASVGEYTTISDAIGDFRNIQNPLPEVQNSGLFESFNQDTLSLIDDLVALDTNFAENFRQISDALSSGDFEEAQRVYEALEYVNFDNLSPEQKPLVDQFFLAMSQYYSFDDIVTQFNNGNDVIESITNSLSIDQRQALMWQVLSLDSVAQVSYFNNLTTIQAIIDNPDNLLSPDLMNQIAINPIFLEAIVQFGNESEDGSSIVLNSYDAWTPEQRQAFTWQTLTLMTPEMQIAYGENLSHLQDGLGLALSPDVVANISLVNSLADSQLAFDNFIELSRQDWNEQVSPENSVLTERFYAIRDLLDQDWTNLESNSDINWDVNGEFIPLGYFQNNEEIPWDIVPEEVQPELEALFTELALIDERLNEIAIPYPQGTDAWESWQQDAMPNEANLYFELLNNPSAIDELANTQILTPLLMELFASNITTGILAENLFTTTGGQGESSIFDQSVQEAVTRLMYEFLPGSDVMIQDDDGTVSRLDEDFNPFDGIQSSISELQAQVDGIEGSISSKIDKIQSQIPTVDDILAQIVIPKPVCNCSCNCQSNSIHDPQDTEEAIAGNKPAPPKNGGKPRG